MKRTVRRGQSKRLCAALTCILIMAVAITGLAGCGSGEPAAASTPAPTIEVTPTPTTGETPTPVPKGGSPPNTPADYYTLTTTVSPSGAGVVTHPGSNLAAGTEAVLTAFPASGYAFDYWGGDASGTSISTVVTMDSSKSVTAHFGPHGVRSIKVTPSSASIQTRRTKHFQAVATYSNGSTSDVTNSVTWGSSSPSVATIAPGGQAMGISAGRVVIRATLGSVSGWASLSVSPS